MIKVGTRVVMTRQMIGISFSDDHTDMDSPEEGMMFIYRGVNGPGMHEFAPDYNQGHDLGFQIDSEDFESDCFRRQFKVVSEWGECFDQETIIDWLQDLQLDEDGMIEEVIDCPESGIVPFAAKAVE